MTSSQPALFLSVEHGDNKVPEEYRQLFKGAESVLSSHRGYDPGAKELAVRFVTRFHAPCEHAEVSRLLVDQNRSLHNLRALFSDFTRPLPQDVKQQIIDVYYWPYQYLVKRRIETLLAENEAVLHLSIHSFTPELNGEVRNCDVGLMYDPKRSVERDFSVRWQKTITDCDPQIRVRRNYPYRGVSDGIVVSMRRQFPASRYIGLQIEINQKFPFGDREPWKHLQKTIVESFSRVLEESQEWQV